MVRFSWAITDGIRARDQTDVPAGMLGSLRGWHPSSENGPGLNYEGEESNDDDNDYSGGDSNSGKQLMIINHPKESNTHDLFLDPNIYDQISRDQITNRFMFFPLRDNSKATIIQNSHTLDQKKAIKTMSDVYLVYPAKEKKIGINSSSLNADRLNLKIQKDSPRGSDTLRVIAWKYDDIGSQFWTFELVLKREEEKIGETISLFDPYELFLLHPSYIAILKKQKFSLDELAKNDLGFFMHLIILLGTIHARNAHKQEILSKNSPLTHFEDIIRLEVDDENSLSVIKAHDSRSSKKVAKDAIWSSIIADGFVESSHGQPALTLIKLKIDG
ncbi:hypothetical protein QVD17_41742 [Tagetes erecta]|uniref:Uncharacterized protein n=1 Tax=Tagetes erecta TaxID=13708 RepID=A0AAD8NDX2_TARER|nr:hypothetical protein QVD17_41742 [Tagetes erecta]